ncbi:MULTISPECIES: transglutaminase family protein [unclassified Caballeronia]|uniref:transglutaminase-like domain-containing protein n=1 Tax=unclassified Caballeronia TaxID=2646786 RepID=UPI0028679874|nr:MULTISPECIES: transglutaminase family protein [unclassified Caballeronia]MDR5818679.1 transglutaminase family protein [Caballeronia sp. LZ033]MDR5822665.1 transglutaminase family protein [Caballeronia sp. LZ043]MDR5879930.1 transglutaminase family protein [Caballeronia sp. LZ032]
MKLRVGFQLTYACTQATPAILMMNTHPSVAECMLEADRIWFDPPLSFTHYYDAFGNLCTRIVTPAGGSLVVATEGVLDLPDTVETHPVDGSEHSVESLPPDALQFLLGSRYCETDLLSNFAWTLFSGVAPGRARVLAVCDYVHDHVRFDYSSARPTRTAFETFNEKIGVCRDYAHLAIALCRALNIPARYCTGYISDVNLPPPHADQDFCAWFEAYLGGTWQIFDPRNNAPRTGRVLMARGRDAADVPISMTFGAADLIGFKVICEKHE